MRVPGSGFLLSGMIALFSLAICSSGCFWDEEKATEQARVHGVIRLEEAVKVNPLYQQYKERMAEYDNLERRYAVEQREIAEKAEVNNKLIQALESDESLMKALDSEYQTKLKIKEDSLNAELRSSYEKYAKQFSRTSSSDISTDIDIRIVNLQLQLQALVLAAEVKKEKEEELRQLLVERDGAAAHYGEETYRKLEEVMMPLKAEAQAQLQAYAETVQGELKLKREEQIAEKAKAIRLQANLPNPVEWHETWKKRLDEKQATVKAVHDTILEDIRSRVAVIAREKELELVVAEYEAAGSAVDITEELIASYKK